MKNILEYNVNKLIDYLNSKKLGFGFKLHPERLHDGKYITGEAFDYIIITKHKTFYFDAKVVSTSRIWTPVKKDITQAINLKKIKELNKNYVCFFLIYFKLEKEIRYLEIDEFYKLKIGNRSIKLKDTKKFNFETFFDIKIPKS